MITLLAKTAMGARYAALRGFLASESAGGVALIVSAVIALSWSNSSAAGLYETLLRLRFGLTFGDAAFVQTLHVWVNDGLMALFFLLVALELRREMTEGHLASPARAAAPALAALGGMAAPALIYAALNWNDRAALRGWAVPTATDIAFALAVISVLGRRVPMALKVFLTALAIIDDLGAILIIALFYTGGLNFGALGGAVLAWAALLGLNLAGVRALAPYLIGGVVLWGLVFFSGVHPTLAGVALAFVVPMAPRAGEARSPACRLEDGLQNWVAFAILPLFGLTNAGLRFAGLPASAWMDPVAIGTALGLVLGKQLGVFGSMLAATRLGLAQMPAGVSKSQLYGASALCGIGFTMSLFIADLAFRAMPRGDEVKLAVFLGSLTSALFGLLVLAFAARRGQVRAAP